MNLGKTFIKGILYENPIFIQVLGMCPTLAVTTSAVNGVGMGLATTAVLLGSNVVISLLRKFIPSKIRIPAFIVVIATFVTVVGLLMKAFVPALDKALGLFIPLIVVNCIILARAEAFASKNSIHQSAVDGIGMGLGFTLSLTVLGSVRELLGAGSIFGFSLLGASYQPALIMILPPGAFLALGLLLALYNWASSKKANQY
ncbi:electron transport complex subunit RsxE [Geosporobacter ferrireducens]|uniref:Ion-translocating oxidoreductase complex subunit E n=1 Tax=Geosporobacter ferrireducens TaxID=1424294 RepID=A0A1D8GPP1_9FIRM|nr:electron transport complex subunit E [Geosporobacter ferrireducens]AOT72744.1 electron transport complex subunit RsxE [Geosporobacter ferrireducens]MTI55158.1 electron transport complex subunit E [Geosporobacter ferrireducens]